jgi:DNA uptake protein ComE-like DNA-binding protein
MSKKFIGLCAISMLTMGLTLGVAGCNSNWHGQDQPNTEEDQKQRDEKTREEVAKATERLKPALENAGKKLGEAAERASEDARAAAEGVKEGWARGTHKPVDLNSATEAELTELPGITVRDARKIIHRRPYRDKRDLVTKGILSDSGYTKIQDQITVKRAP